MTPFIFSVFDVLDTFIISLFWDIMFECRILLSIYIKKKHVIEMYVFTWVKFRFDLVLCPTQCSMLTGIQMKLIAELNMLLCFEITLQVCSLSFSFHSLVYGITVFHFCLKRLIW